MSDLVKKEDPGALVSVDFLNELPSAEATDFKIPNAILCQPSSGMGNPGEVIDTNSKRVLTTLDKPMNFIPLYFYKDYTIIHILNGGDRKWQRTEPSNPDTNKRYRREWKVPIENGVEERMERVNVFFILEEDILNPMADIFVFRFKGASGAEGRKVLAFWERAKGAKQAPYSFVFSLTPTLVKAENRKYYVAQVANVRETIDGKNSYKQISGDALSTATMLVKMIVDSRAQVLRATKDEDAISF